MATGSDRAAPRIVMHCVRCCSIRANSRSDDGIALATASVMQALSSRVPPERVDVRTDLPPKTDGAYVLYWMTMFRRRRCNFALQRAVDWARALDRPLLILEALRCGYPYASDRLHAFILEGMGDNERAFAGERRGGRQELGERGRRHHPTLAINRDRAIEIGKWTCLDRDEILARDRRHRIEHSAVGHALRA